MYISGIKTYVSEAPFRDQRTPFPELNVQNQRPKPSQLAFLKTLQESIKIKNYIKSHKELLNLAIKSHEITQSPSQNRKTKLRSAFKIPKPKKQIAAGNQSETTRFDLYLSLNPISERKYQFQIQKLPIPPRRKQKPDQIRIYGSLKQRNSISTRSVAKFRAETTRTQNCLSETRIRGRKRRFRR